MNRHALEVLQFPEALELVARYASSPLGAEAVRALEPADAPGWIEPELRRVEQMAALLLRAEDWTLPPIPDLRAPLRRLNAEGYVWEPVWLRDAGQLLRSSRETRRAVLYYREDYPLLADAAERLVKLEELEQAIRQAIDDNAEVRDDASRELARLRREMRGARSRIVEKLERFMAQLPDRVRVADASVSIRDGRYVVPIRREGRGDVGGIVHDESATGQTLFVEPPAAIELMNRLRELELAEAREVQRILRELSDRLRPHAAELTAALEALVALDSLFARARYALEYNGHRPELLAAGSHEYVVVNGYHPLLLAGPDPVVPFDLRMEPGERTLLVSGPNTGGKTVLLKCIGLLSALTQAGILPPVGAGSRLPIFRDVFADIGDEQSIEASLSTFSAHLKNLREVLDDADAESLVLIDEIGSGTDPSEGAALAQAVLVTLTRRRTLTFATTHLGQLKLLAGKEPAVANASLQFDSTRLEPTYRLVKGVPGRSYGLAIARRLGFPDAVLERAEAALPSGEREVNELLLELEQKERRTAQALADAEAARSQTERLREELEAREAELRRREQDAERRARQQARDFLLEAREEVETTIRELRERAAAEDLELEAAARAARRRVEEAAQRQAQKAPRQRSSHGPEAAPGELAPGQAVRVGQTGAVGVLVELRDGRAVVEAGGMRLQVPAADLIAAPEEARKKRPAGAGVGWSAPEVEARPEVDLRGLRADEALAELEPALDAAMRADLKTLRIIHGKGTGALREVVTELLRTHPHVGSFRPGGTGEGGTGVTVAELR